MRRELVDETRQAKESASCSADVAEAVSFEDSLGKSGGHSDAHKRHTSRSHADPYGVLEVLSVRRVVCLLIFQRSERREF